ncbi:MAG: putative peptidoglycan glycosyltransferase FtsW [Pseudomonadota bacterium]
MIKQDRSILSEWWWEIDKWQFACVIGLAIIGFFLILSAGPPAAERIRIDSSTFVFKHLVFLPVGLCLMLFCSGLSVRNMRRCCILILVCSLTGMVLTIFTGVEVKGASRWIQVFGFTVQPSEFVKPTLAILLAWFLSAQRIGEPIYGYAIAVFLYLLVVGLLMLQPDFGQTILVSLVFASQLFLIGLPLLVVFLLSIIGILGMVLSYFYIPHVRSRIDRFFNPESGDTFQIDRSIEAFKSGGFIGVGPGEGRVKYQIPDGHADFIFAVGAEEYGMVLCLIILALFVGILISVALRTFRMNDLFAVLASAGLMIQFGLQALINIASTVNLIPTKGMTLPFISYGGSSMLASCIAMGFVLSITRRRLHL